MYCWSPTRHPCTTYLPGMQTAAACLEGRRSSCIGVLTWPLMLLIFFLVSGIDFLSSAGHLRMFAYQLVPRCCCLCMLCVPACPLSVVVCAHRVCQLFLVHCCLCTLYVPACPLSIVACACLRANLFLVCCCLCTLCMPAVPCCYPSPVCAYLFMPAVLRCYLSPVCAHWCVPACLLSICCLRMLCIRVITCFLSVHGSPCRLLFFVMRNSGMLSGKRVPSLAQTLSSPFQLGTFYLISICNQVIIAVY